MYEGKAEPHRAASTAVDSSPARFHGERKRINARKLLRPYLLLLYFITDEKMEKCCSPDSQRIKWVHQMTERAWMWSSQRRTCTVTSETC